VEGFSGRLQALSRAHDLIAKQRLSGASLSALVEEQVVIGHDDDPRLACAGPDIMLEERIAVHLALVLHELATNARKYGALSVPTGRLSVTWQVDVRSGRELHIKWIEHGVHKLTAPRSQGFGTTVIERSLEANGGAASIRYGGDGISCNIRLPLPEEVRFVAWDGSTAQEKRELWLRQPPVNDGRGKRILVVEDEPLVAMDIEVELKSAGFVVVGPALHYQSASRLIDEEEYDVALLDANLNGHSVEELASALTQKNIPFAFVSGYGRAGLPIAFRNAELVVKPFLPGRLASVAHLLLARRGAPSAHVVELKPRSS
jgi:CheY-like chemotaxis protein